MNKLFTKLAKVFLGLSLAAGVGVAVGSSSKEATPVEASSSSSSAPTNATYSHVFSSGQLAVTSTGTATLSNITWNTTCANTSAYVGWDNTKGIQLGSGTSGKTIQSGYTISTAVSNFGTNKKVTKMAVGMSNASSGGYSGTFPNSDTWSGTATSVTYYTSTAMSITSGNITFSFQSTKQKAVYIKAIYVWYESASTPLTSIGLSGTGVSSNAISIVSSDSTAHTINISLTPSTATDQKVNIAHQSGTSGLFTKSASQITCSSGSGSFTITGTGGTSGSETFRISGNTETGVYVDLVVTALDDSVTYYTVTYSTAVSTVSPTSEQVEANGHPSLPTPTALAHYTFNGWKLNGTLIDGTLVVTDDITLVADWTEDAKYTVTYVAGDHGSGSNYVVNNQYAGSYTLTTFATAGFTASSGYAFSKWSVGGVEYAEGASITISGATTVTAVYQEVTTYTIVTDASTLKDGTTFVLVGYISSTYYVSNGLNSGHVLLTSKTAATTISNGVASGSTLVSTEAQVLTLEGSTGAFKIKYGDSYLKFTGSSNGDDSFDTEANASTFSASMSGSYILFTCTSSTGSGRVWRLNTGSKDMRNYATSSGVGDVYMFANIPVSSLSSVAITTNATKTSFYAGDTFDPSGLVLTATYSDETTEDVTSSASYKYGASGINPTSAGTDITTSTVLNVSDHNGKTIYVLYTENSVTKYDSYTITVESARTINKVETGGDMETKEYYQGDDWDFTGLYLTVTWNKGTPNPTTVNLSDLTKDTDFTCYPDDASDLDTTEIYIYGEYEGFEFEFTIEDIEVNEKPIADLLRCASTSLNHSSTQYGDVSGRNSSNASDITSNATWAGTIACNTSKDNALQLNGTTRGIYTTASSKQYIKSITVDFYDANSKNLYFYGSNTAYSGIISSNFGTLLATFTSSDTKSVTAGQFKYCYIYSSGAQYMNSITIEWGDLAPTLSLSTTSFSFTEGDSGTLSTTATPANFDGTVSYSFTSSDSTVLSASNVSASTNTISFNKSNCSAGSATITVTATYSTQSAAATFTVECVAAQRNLTSIAITTSSSDTLFEKDTIFTINDLVVTGTFDAAPLSSDVTADCTFKLWDGSSETALTPGTTTLGTAGDFTVRITHSENTHSPAQILTYSISVFATQNFTLGSEGAAGYGSGVTNDFDVTLNSSTSLTSTVDVYSYNFYSNTGMQMNVSSRGNAYIYNTIAVPGKIVRIELTWKQEYAGSTPTIYFSNSYMDEAPASGGIMGTSNVTTDSIVPASGNNYYFYFNAQTTSGAIVLTSLKVVYIETAAGQVQNFADKYLHMNDYTSSEGYCMNDSDQHYYSDAKTAYGKLSTEQKSAFADNSAAVARLQAWARANGETFDPSAKTFTANPRVSLINVIGKNTNTVAIIVIISMVSMTAIGGYFFLRKRKENN